ncbi:MAG: LytTR family DNA-binding domain-containing protein [Bacteroidia bacterium]|nr:LytTR family DNA-binding domain-containing protein [Bacteroidia bacterium]
MNDFTHHTNCLVVDDEPNAIRILQEYLKEFNNLVLAGTAGNAFDALHILQTNKIDLLFLDIQMPQITGLQLLKTLADPSAVIITTAHRDYAVDAFDFQVLDFLLKPISFERFSRSVNRYFEFRREKDPYVQADEPDQPVLMIRSNRKDIRIPVHEILYLQAMGDYVILFLESGEKHMTIETITGISERLPVNEFARIHRSFIVNRRHIRAIGSKTVEIGKVSLPVSRNYRPLI